MMAPPLDVARGALSASRGALAFAWRSLVRQPARATLGILGVAAVGALLFDMLLLSQGLVTSMQDLLDSTGFDIRVAATDPIPGEPDIQDGPAAAAQIAALPSVSAAIAVRTEDADLQQPDGRTTRATLVGVSGGRARPWTILRGTDISPPSRGFGPPSPASGFGEAGGPHELVINDQAAQELGAAPGATVTIKAYCSGGAEAPPAIPFRIAGIAEFPFDAPNQSGAGTTTASLANACGTPDARTADLVMVTSAGDPDAAASAIAALRPDLRAFTNNEAVGQMQQRGFTYFRQISTVLTTITVSFALLLITVLLTVSVNQRIGEVAALRALGFSQGRVVLDVLFESALIVGIGGLLSLPLGAALAVWLDGILKRMPNLPAALHFFVFDPQALWIHGGLLAATAVLAALYPMRIVARLPIAATLRDEVME
jgi:putative ABC transport system permease protein